MATENSSDSSDSEPKPGPSGVIFPRKAEVKVEDSSSSDSDINAFSKHFNPIKALYADKVVLLVHDPPMYENLQQYEASLISKNRNILTVGKGKEAQEREEKKKLDKLAYEKALEEKNRLRFAKYEAPVIPVKKEGKNVFTRQAAITGPLAALRACMERQLKVKVMTRGPAGVRGYLHGFVAAFDKHWNLLLTEVLEVYRRKSTKKLKIPPAGGRPVPKGTADLISHLPEARATSVGNGMWECARYLPQVMVRGEHVVTINIIDQ